MLAGLAKKVTSELSCLGFPDIYVLDATLSCTCSTRASAGGYCKSEKER
jgi:hypothetical protein